MTAAEVDTDVDTDLDVVEVDVVAAGVRGRIAEVLGVSPDDLADRTDLVAEHAVDSLDVMEIGARLEKTFAVRLQVEDLIGIRRVGDVVALVRRHVQDRP